MAGALDRPKGIRLNSNRPIGVVNAVFDLSDSSISTCQYPLARSRVEKKDACPSASRDSSILGRGNASFRVLELSFL